MANPTQICPYCGERCEAEFIDNGIGMQQVTPYLCLCCGAFEIGPYDKCNASLKERRIGWYRGDVNEQL